MPNQDYSGILIYAQLTRDNYIHTVFFELLDKAKELSQKLGGVEVNAVFFANPESINGLKDSFKNMGVDNVYYFDDKSLKDYSSEYYSKLFVDLVLEIKPEIVLIGATSQGRDLAPRVSSSLHTGLTADCVSLDINEKGLLAATRPTFGGELMATILCKNYPQMVTVRPNVFKAQAVSDNKNTKFFKRSVNFDGIDKRTKILEFKRNVKTLINDLDSAEIVVAGGMGLKNEKGFALLKEFADYIGGSVAASRPAVEAGFVPRELQVGQTGKTVRPKVYVACGISGAIQHVVGMENSEHIIAINSDADAPIFEIADVGIVGDFFEIVPRFLEK